jgi:hypothetical protein
MKCQDEQEMKMSRKSQRAAERLSQRYSDKRLQAVVQAASAAGLPGAALNELERLSKTPEFVNFNVNSPNNRKRLLKLMGVEA